MNVLGHFLLKTTKVSVFKSVRSIYLSEYIFSSMSQSLLFISTEGALRLPTTYDNHPIPIPSVQPANSRTKS